ncbi:MAG: rod shape-determining protein MreD [Polyangiaceae bacterium]
MRSLGFLALGLVLLLVQGNLFRVIDETSPWLAGVLWAIALFADVARTIRQARGTSGRPQVVAGLRADWLLPATVLLGYALLVSLGRSRGADIGRPIPALVLPIILFMGVHEYSLARGAAVAFVLGYATDVLGIAPVGLYTFTFVATFVLARAAGVRLAAQTTWMQVLLTGAFALLQSTMVLVLLAIFGRDAWVPRSLYPLALPQAIATAAVAPIVFRFAEALDRVTASTPRAETGARGSS